LSGLLRSELYRLLRRRMTLILAGLLPGVVLLLYLAFALALSSGDAANMDAQTVSDLETMVAVESILAFADDLVWQLVAVMGVILMASAIGSEFAWRTVLTITTWTGDRVRPLIARFIVVAALSFVGVLIGFISAIAGSVIVNAMRGTFGGDQFSAGLLADTGVAILTTWYAALPYILLAGALAMLGRGTGVGIGVGLAVLFLEGFSITIIDQFGDTLAWVKHLTMNWNVQAVMGVNGYIPGVSSPPPPEVPAAWRGALMLVLFILGYASSTILLFVRRDINE
jgi:ABC-type transport system involved in multi-copper enzyme maturation permease subunit